MFGQWKPPANFKIEFFVIRVAAPKHFANLLRNVHRQDWVVYAKPAFGGPAQVLRYLGRYTHRVAISNHRIVSFDGEHVTFRYKDYAHGGKHRVMTLAAVEFLRRFFLHILPKGFVRIRHFGFLANRWRKARLAICREVLGCATNISVVEAKPTGELISCRRGVPPRQRSRKLPGRV